MNLQKFKAKCIEKNIKYETIAKKINVDISTFYRKLKAKSFTIKQVNQIAIILNLNYDEIMSIFFDGYVAYMRNESN